jgi:uncharacterized Tic20 family protein
MARIPADASGALDEAKGRVMSDGNPTSSQGQVQPGWYPDPATGRPRWWDGSQWGPFQTPAASYPVSAAGYSMARSPEDARRTAALAHYLGLLGFIGPLIIYVTNNPGDPYVRDQSVEALNFHLAVVIAWFVVIVVGFVTCGIGFILALPLWIGEIAFSIMGGMAASRGEWYRYPLNIRMIKSGV